jgi:hypothetical protein
MRQIYTETCNYQDLALAIHNEFVNGSDGDNIKYESAIYKNAVIHARTLPICENTNETLLWMGFRKHFVYNFAHFKEHLYAPMSELPENANNEIKKMYKEHGHHGTLDDLQKLPTLLLTPFAIITEDQERTEARVGNHQPLIFLSCEQQVDRPVYRKIVVQPQSCHLGITEFYKASEVITCYQIDEHVFHAMLNGVNNGRHELLYFDTEQYRALDYQNKIPALENNTFEPKKIFGHFKPFENISQVLRDHKQAIRSAADAAVLQFGTKDKNIRQDMYHGPFWRAVDILKSEVSKLEDILEARTLIDKTCSRARDKYAVKKTREKTDVLFAQAYVRIMTKDKQNRILQSACSSVEKLSDYIKTEDDMDIMYDETDKIETAVPTLKNLSIVFSGNVVDNQYVIQAGKVSGQLEEIISSGLQELIDRKYEEIDGYNWNGIKPRGE